MSLAASGPPAVLYLRAATDPRINSVNICAVVNVSTVYDVCMNIDVYDIFFVL
jgi:hypothetical protein